MAGVRRGRPAFQITPKMIAEAERLAGLGLTKEQIAAGLGICRDTLYRKERDFSDLSDAIKKGQASGIAKISNALFENAKSGNVTAQIFYLKNRAPSQWKDRVAAFDDNTPVPEKITVEIVDGRLIKP